MACPQQEEASWRPRWLLIYIQWPFRGPLMAQQRPASISHPVTLGWKLTLHLWRRQCGGKKLAGGGQNQLSGMSGGIDEVQRNNGYAQRWQASVGPPEAHLAAQLCATHWLRCGCSKNIFPLQRIGLPAARGGMVKAKVTT